MRLNGFAVDLRTSSLFNTCKSLTPEQRTGNTTVKLTV
jgi:hypothetical protein